MTEQPGEYNLITSHQVEAFQYAGSIPLVKGLAQMVTGLEELVRGGMLLLDSTEYAP